MPRRFLLLAAWALTPWAAATAADLPFGGTRHSVAIGTHRGFVIEPPAQAPGGRRPWLWYAPTFIGSYPNASCAWYLEALVKRGFWIAGLDVGESYGNPAGRKAFSAFHDTVRTRFRLDARACLMAQSRGGLMLYNWAAEPGNAAKVARIAGIYTVGDLRSYPGLAVAAPAYGMTEPQLQAALAFHNPVERLSPLRSAGIPILHIHGDADALVPLEKNSQAVRNRYVALGGSMELIVVPGKGHAEIPEFFQARTVLDFLLAELATTAVEAEKPRDVREAARRPPARDALGRRDSVGKGAGGIPRRARFSGD